MKKLSRRSFALAALGFSAALIAGCATSGDGSGSGAPSADDTAGSAGTGDGAPSADAPATPVRLGTLATEDFLPGWVAEAEGLADASVELQVTPFQSAQELSAAIAAGEIDMAMTDHMVSAALFAGGVDVRLLWVTLGADPAQGRFGIQVGPESQIASPDDLRGASIGVGSNTVPEYVMDKLLEAAGIGADDFVKEEVKKVPVRFQMMQSGQTDAAALPASLLALGEATGCRTILDDSTGENLSQSVMIARTAFFDENPEAVDAVRAAWNAAAEKINADPEGYRALLVEKANLSDAVSETYPICEYPTDIVPTAEMVQPVLDWMNQKGYLSEPLSFDEGTGAFVSAGE